MNTYKKPLFIHWFYYFSAIISYGIAFILLVVHYYQQSLVMPLGVYFLLFYCILYPHITFGVQLKIGFNERNERFCMLLDAGLSGIFANFIAVFSAPALLFFMLTMTNIMLGHGLRIFLMGLAFAFFNFIISISLIGVHVFDEVSFGLNAGSGLLILVYPIYLAYVINFRTNALKKSKATLKTQKNEIEEQKNEIEIQKNEMQELNEELHQLNEELATTVDTISFQKNRIERQNDDITQSINYAKRIQEAAMPSKELIKSLIPDSFILHKPKNIVSGDFYFIAEHEQKLFVAAVDCTGHGIPGAFMSLLANDLLTDIITKRNITQVDEILNQLNLGIRKILRQEETKNRDGMDIALLSIDQSTQEVTFAGAKNPLVYITHQTLFHVKGCNMHIGGEQRLEKQFIKHVLPIQELGKTTFYLFSDGYQDQFGGEKRRKFMAKNLHTKLLEMHQDSFQEQKKYLEETIEHWKDIAKEQQTDDILMMGFKLP